MTCSSDGRRSSEVRHRVRVCRRGCGARGMRAATCSDRSNPTNDELCAAHGCGDVRAGQLAAGLRRDPRRRRDAALRDGRLERGDAPMHRRRKVRWRSPRMHVEAVRAPAGSDRPRQQRGARCVAGAERRVLAAGTRRRSGPRAAHAVRRRRCNAGRSPSTDACCDTATTACGRAAASGMAPKSSGRMPIRAPAGSRRNASLRRPEMDARALSPAPHLPGERIRARPQ